jgi:polyhydroxybutyrate depolymerase
VRATIRSSLRGVRAIAGLSASTLVRRPDQAIRGFIGGVQFALPPRAIAMRRSRAHERPTHDLQSARRHRPSDFVLSLVHEGIVREALIHLPPSTRRAIPFIFNFHGFTSDAQEQSAYTQMNRIAADHGCAVVHPQGTHSLLGYRAWNAGGYFDKAMDRPVDDVGFVAALMAELESAFRVREWFATGISNGGMLSYRLAYAMPGRFRAIAPVAAIDLTDAPIPPQKIGVLHVHGINDGLVPYHERAFRVASLLGGFGWKRSARQSLLRFADHNGASDPEIKIVGNCRYEIWRGKATAQLVVHRGGHTWLGDGFRIDRRRESAVAEGSREIVRFFLDHASMA